MLYGRGKLVQKHDNEKRDATTLYLRQSKATACTDGNNSSGEEALSS
jgi:hypothetical protein